MDLDGAISSHVAWRMKLRGAISRKEILDAAGIRAAARCELGKWLGGEGRATRGDLPELAALAQCHERFHQEAARVAEAVNAKEYAKAEKMLGSGSEYTQASTEVGKAILALQQRGA